MCARVNTCTQRLPNRLPSSLAVAFYLPHFLLCLLEGSPAVLFPPPSDLIVFSSESSTASRRTGGGWCTQGRIKRSRRPCRSSLSPREPANRISEQSGWQVKFSPGFNSTAPLNRRPKPSREKDFADKRSRGAREKPPPSSFRRFPHTQERVTDVCYSYARYGTFIKLYEFVIHVNDAPG